MYRGNLNLTNWDRGSQLIIKIEIMKAKPKYNKKVKTNATTKMI
ncbi:hypothetical protein ES703_59522 [subsurface metagenome]